MELAFEIPSTCSGVVTNRCELKVADHVFNNLDDVHKGLFVKSCFRTLEHIPNLKLASQIIHHLLQRTLKSSENEKDAVWFKFGEKEARFGLQEFSLVSGFKIVHDVASYEVPERSSSLLHLFKGKRGKLTKKDLLNKFDDLVKKEEDADLIYKLGLLTVLEHVVLSNECRTLVDEKWFHLVENLEEFNSYPWGNLSYEYTVKLFKRKRFGHLRHCLRLEENLLKLVVEVRRTLQPSRDEVKTSYLKEFRIVPEDEEEEEEEEENEDKDDEEDEEEEEEKNDASQSDPPQPQVFGAEKLSAIVREVVKDEMRLFSEHDQFTISHARERKVGVHDDVGLEMRVKEKVVLVEDKFSEEVVSPKKNEHGFDTGVVTDPSSKIFQELPMEIEETDEDDAPESPKGRGHRKKRKATVLLTPWRNPGKRQKIPNVMEYDPHRTLDEAKLEDLRRWLANSPESDEIDVAWGSGSAGKKNFNDLLDDKWLCSGHVDAALFHMRCRAIEYPHLFRQDCVTLDPHFVSYARMFFKDASKVESFDRTNFPKALVKYAEGKVPPHAKAWTSCTKLFVAFCTENNEHWVALDIDLSKRCIDVYDSSPSVMRKRQFETELEPIRVVVPMLMRMLNATYSSEKFDLKRLPCPSQANGREDDVCRNGFWQLWLTRRQPCQNISCRKEGVSKLGRNKWPEVVLSPEIGDERNDFLERSGSACHGRDVYRGRDYRASRSSQERHYVVARLQIWCHKSARRLVTTAMQRLSRAS
ncbi:hypothetical protein STAS_03531 [Striga asiatica]|uniref:Ulp1 protease family protein n=1 Tax=Striga asiatica TaxID=4170 RepID=A0A5A7P5R4_STRAF|nr:hypothetical protein STAS_03531 [Striga asiatica]